MNHLVSDISKILPNSFQLASQVVKASKEHDVHVQRQQQKAKNKQKQARIPRRQKKSLQSPLTFAMTLLYDLEENYQRILFPILLTRPTSPAMSAKPRGTTPTSAQ
jgi:hypothetical protein